MRYLTMLLLLATSACTWGRVTWGGSPVAGSDVTFRSCDGDTWTARADSRGYYGIDGHALGDDAVAEETVLMSASTGPGSTTVRYEMVTVDYGPCPDDPDALCSRHDLDFGFRPLSGWEWSLFYEQLDDHNDITRYSFYNELCRWR